MRDDFCNALPERWSSLRFIKAVCMTSIILNPVDCNKFNPCLVKSMLRLTSGAARLTSSGSILNRPVADLEAFERVRVLLASGDGCHGTLHSGDEAAVPGAVSALRLLDLGGLWGLLASSSPTALLGMPFRCPFVRNLETVRFAHDVPGGSAMLPKL